MLPQTVAACLSSVLCYLQEESQQKFFEKVAILVFAACHSLWLSSEGQRDAKGTGTVRAARAA